MVTAPEPACSAALLTRHNIGNIEVAKDAKHEFDRCRTDADFAAWARRWGEAFVMHRLFAQSFR